MLKSDDSGRFKIRACCRKVILSGDRRLWMKVIANAHDACFVEACTSEVICKSLRMNQILGGGEVSVVFDSF